MFLGGRGLRADPSKQDGAGRRNTTFTVARRDFVRALRLSGTVEAIQSMTIAAPRLTGPNAMSLVITRLVRPGSAIQPGDLIVEFDRQQQLTNALDRRVELQDLDQQIRKREAQELSATARDEGEIKLAESTLARAELEMQKNEMIPKINAEKNVNALEQARATLKQLKATFDLKRQGRRTRICGFSASGAIAPRTPCGRRRPTPSGWRSRRRSVAWPS